MKLRNIFLLFILLVVAFQFSNASWYDKHLNLKLAVDCTTYSNNGAEAAYTPDPEIGEWVSNIDESCVGKSVAQFPGSVTLSDACPILDASPTESFVIYNDLARVRSCGGSFNLF